MKKIDGSPKSLKQLLLNTKYTIHYYQREYMWGRKQIEELVDDLTSEFLNNYTPGDSREKVMDYGAYFMGSVVLAGRENAIIDGQQRLTSLTLLLLFLRSKMNEIGQNYSTVDGMIYSEAFGKRSFNINVDEREAVLNSIYNNVDYKYDGKNESVKNIMNRYSDINEIFPIEIIENSLMNFIDWIIEKIFFIEIVATEEQDAHKVFVSMNDRGLSLTPTEMLKGYLLSEIVNDENREKYNDLWKEQVVLLKEIDKSEDETFIKHWLRARYAETIRETKANAIPMDFDNIGSGFHKWVRENRNLMKLHTSEDFEKLIDEFIFYSKLYIRIKNYESNLDKDFKNIFYNAQLGFTFQMQLLFAPINLSDTEEIINKKLDLVSKYIDMYIYSRVINYRSCDYNTVKNRVFRITNEIRGLSVEELSNKLIDYVNTSEQKMDRFTYWEVNGFTKKYIKHLLARITGFIEESIDMPNNYCSYIDIYSRNPYEVEHITCDHFEWFQDIYTSEQEFDSFRNNIGDLVLLPKSINASLNDEKYTYKVNKYCSNEGNILAATLGNITYQNNPRFIRFMNDNNLPFESYESFGKQEIIKRRELYKKIVDIIWNIDNLKI